MIILFHMIFLWNKLQNLLWCSGLAVLMHKKMNVWLPGLLIKPQKICGWFPQSYMFLIILVAASPKCCNFKESISTEWASDQ